ncbi:aminomethyl-transferring glycine dehydrogenase subunit GcvPA [Candidatus Poribacteria bacterium]|nr:aminomethyl-transferring glycine dehydrogenase subunit GcvPA [Candidatus Poribacteria bacterium]
MAYTPHTPGDVRAMLESIGVKTVDDLFCDVPRDLILDRPLNIPALDEYALTRYFEKAASENRTVAPGKLFLGAGAYQHYIPAAVRNLVTRGEFVTCYTPYQAEVSQGTLQAIFEFQSHICALTGMEAANASMYDGATALAEALILAVRHTRRNVVYLPKLLHPNYRRVVETYMRELNIEVRLLGVKDGRTMFREEIESAVEAAAVVVQTPNFFGTLENAENARLVADRGGALLIACCNPTALAMIEPPGAYGADIAVGEAQPLGIPLQFGGPYAGYFACKKELVRQMPGRIVGRTTDAQGREGFVLTLQTREQHIRRERATSNICTNQGLFALMVTMYLTFAGREGLLAVAETCAARMQSLLSKLMDETDAEALYPGAPFFHEAAIKLPIPAADFLERMSEDFGIVAGLDGARFFPEHEDVVLVCATEMNTPRDVDDYVTAAKRVLSEAMVS